MTGERQLRTRYSVAIPASIASDTPHLREKTAKLGLIARACASFGVQEIILYADDAQQDQREDLRFCELILNFVETPQYLRKRLFRLDPMLRFTGILPPLQTPHHNVPHTIGESKIGDLRDGIVIGRHGESLVLDVGLEETLESHGTLRVGSRATVQITGLRRKLVGEIVEESKISIYWGYRVRLPKFRLGSLLEKEKFDLRIGTSRYGTPLVDVWSQISSSLRNVGRVLIVFGSPRMGLREILNQERKNPEDLFDFFVNTVPDQNVATVRSEEAVLISLGIFNAMRNM